MDEAMDKEDYPSRDAPKTVFFTSTKPSTLPKRENGVMANQGSGYQQHNLLSLNVPSSSTSAGPFSNSKPNQSGPTDNPNSAEKNAQSTPPHEPLRAHGGGRRTLQQL